MNPQDSIKKEVDGESKVRSCDYFGFSSRERHILQPMLTAVGIPCMAARPAKENGRWASHSSTRWSFCCKAITKTQPSNASLHSDGNNKTNTVCRRTRVWGHHRSLSWECEHEKKRSPTSPIRTGAGLCRLRLLTRRFLRPKKSLGISHCKWTEEAGHVKVHT